MSYPCQCVRPCIDVEHIDRQIIEWPDWRTADPTKAIEHVRGTDD